MSVKPACARCHLYFSSIFSWNGYLSLSVTAEDFPLIQAPCHATSCPVFHSLLSSGSSLKACSCFQPVPQTLNLCWLTVWCCELCTCSYPTSAAESLQMAVSKGDSGRNLKITVEQDMQGCLEPVHAGAASPAPLQNCTTQTPAQNLSTLRLPPAQPSQHLHQQHQPVGSYG